MDKDNIITNKVHWVSGSVSDLPQNEEYCVVDICKFIFSLMVVGIHIPPLSSFDSRIAQLFSFGLTQCLFRVADPFYFIAAGFLLFRKIDICKFDTGRVKKYVFKILRLYGLWSVLLLLGGTGQLWFLGGLAIAVLIISFLLQKTRSLQIMGCISLLLFIVGVLDVSYIGIITKFAPPIGTVFHFFDAINFTAKVGLIMGIPYVFMGVLFAKKRFILSKLQVISGCIVSFTLLFCEAFTINKLGCSQDYYQLFFLLPFSFFLFYLVTHIKLEVKPIYEELRTIGMFVFYSHLFVHGTLVLSLNIANKVGLNCESFANNSLAMYSFTVIVSVIIGIIVYRLSSKNRFRFLRYLYS